MFLLIWQRNIFIVFNKSRPTMYDAKFRESHQHALHGLDLDGGPLNYVTAISPHIAPMLSIIPPRAFFNLL